MRRKESLLGIIEDHRKVKIRVKKFLKNVGLLGDINRLFFFFFLKFKRIFSGRGDIEFEEKRTP